MNRRERLTVVDLDDRIVKYIPIHGPPVLFEVTSIYNASSDTAIVDDEDIRAFLGSPRFATLTIEHVPAMPNPDMFMVIVHQPDTAKLYTIDGPIILG